MSRLDISDAVFIALFVVSIAAGLLSLYWEYS